MKRETYDKSWIEAELLKYYMDTSMVSELSNSTMTLLLSTKSDEELQNEVSFHILSKLFNVRALMFQVASCFAEMTEELILLILLELFIDNINRYPATLSVIREPNDCVSNKNPLIFCFIKEKENLNF